ncbi:MAG: mobile mystery protein B [Bacteriovoracaceae bacterium]
MSHHYFQDRDGSTPLDSEQARGLKFKHVTTMAELDELEDRNIQKGLDWLYAYKGSDFLSVDFMNKLHTKLFGDVWKWAGKYRLVNVNLSKLHPAEVSGALKVMFLDFKTWSESSNVNWEEWSAEFHHRLVSIHPYPNGNGRTTRIYTEYIQKRFGQKMTSWKASLKEDPRKRREEYIKALRLADQGDYLSLMSFMQEKI